MISSHSPPPAVRTVKAVYDFAVDGGVVGDIGLGVNLPINAIVTRSWYEVLTAPTSGGAATIALGIPVDDVDGILGATPLGGAFIEDEHDAIQTGAAGQFSAKTTANRELTLTIAVADLTAGKLVLYVDYITSV